MNKTMVAVARILCAATAGANAVDDWDPDNFPLSRHLHSALRFGIIRPIK